MKKIILFVVVLHLLPGLLQAQTIAGGWHSVRGMFTGQVTTETGDRVLATALTKLLRYLFPE